MKQILACKNCDRVLSHPVEIDFKPVSHANLRSDSRDAVAFGAGISVTVTRWNSEKQKDISETVVWINAADLYDSVTQLPRYQGCCGLEGPNVRCQCGEIVGSNYTDCMDYFHFEAFENKTYWKNEK